MVGVLTLHRTTIGKKVIMAVTGLIGVGFVFGHMYGNLKVFFGAEEFNKYAHGLRTLGSPIFTHSEPLWLVRLVLLASVGLHAWAAWSLYQESQHARGQKYAMHRKLQANPAVNYIRFGGTVIFIFLVLHLMHFTWGISGVHPDFRSGDAYHNLVVGFQSYGYFPAIFYLVAVLLLGFHLYHGTWSMFQTLGLNNQTFTKPLRAAAMAVAVVITAGFAVVPLAVMLGWVA
jgi:succinate dehydrogenase / fumarate reductase cytochrome b subunit